MQRIFRNFKGFLIVWAVVLLINQVVLFGACFAPYCLIAAVPHTLLIAVVFSYFVFAPEDGAQQKKSTERNATSRTSQGTGTTGQKRESSRNKTEAKPKPFKFEPNKSPESKIDTLPPEQDVLKNRGDGYELHIGRKFEIKGDLVIYNGFIRGYEDQGVDVIAISKSTRSLHLIQCKHWQRLEFTRDHLYRIYQKLDNFDRDYQFIDPSEINYYLGIKKDNGEIRSEIQDSLSYPQTRKTLYLSSSHVVQKDVWQSLEQIKDNIYRFKDMKIVVYKIL